MKKIWLFVLAMSAAQCGAFPINPFTTTVDEARKKYQSYWDFVERFSVNAHEQISRLAYDCAAQFTSEVRACRPAGGGKLDGLDADNIIHGVRWNDDPNNFFRSGLPLTWFSWMAQAEGMAEVQRIDPLQHRSHYGDLQFLHAMSLASRSYEETRKDVLDWAHFAYDVATGVIKPGARLAKLEAEHAFAGYFSGLKKKADWTVRDLFANIGDYKRLGSLNLTSAQVRAMALGALLHTVQDSYSTSHAEREGLDYHIVSWLDYGSQHSTCHTGGDGELDFLKSEKVLETKVVLNSAWIIDAVARKERWGDGVSDQFANVIFPTGGVFRSSDGGACQKHQLVASLKIDGEPESLQKSTVSLLRGGAIKVTSASRGIGCDYQLNLKGAAPGVVNILTTKIVCNGREAPPLELALPLNEEKSFDFNENTEFDVQLKVALKRQP